MVTFEIRDKDAMGRTGVLEIGSKEVDTPALMPVLNPHLHTPELDEAEVVITNSYIIHGSDDYRSEAVENGLHELLDFDGVVVTDSGSYQMSVYGESEVEVPNSEIVEFQREIGSDVVTPLDVPTPPDASYDEAENDLETTLRRIDEAEEVLTRSEEGRETALNTPIQGALHGDLRERSAREVRGEGDIYPIGGVVPLMKQYRFDDLVDVVMASKSGLGADVPVHLFGTGHPMVFGFAAAMGCDLFDSAAYALYAENGRYLTFEGTQDADDLKELPCSCPVCRDWEPDEVTEFERLSQHNLNISFAEMRRVRQSIRRGELLEHIERRCRSHPTLLDGLRRLYDYSERIETSDPSSKSTFFYLGSTSSERPEVLRHHRRLDRFEVEDEAVVTTANVKKGEEDISVFRLNPPFGPYPPELEETYPVNAETPEEDDYYAVGSSLEGVLRLVELNPDARFVLEHPGWEHPHIENLEDKGVETRSLDRDTTLTETDGNSGRESGDDDGDEKEGG